MENFLIFLGTVLVIGILYRYHKRLKAKEVSKEVIPGDKSVWKQLAKNSFVYIAVTAILLAIVFALQFIP